MDKNQLAGMIDHTLLKAEATKAELKKLCDEAKEFSFKTVCVNSCNVAFCAKELEGCVTKPIAVVGFPLGAMSSAAKAFETEQAIKDGAQEIDTVINVGALKELDYSLVYEDILAVVKAAGEKPVKVIIESAMLTDNEIVIACALSKAAGAAFVKTSTGFNKAGGASEHAVALMRATVGPEMGVKASGGVRTTEDALKMIEAGASRIGCSAGIAIINGL